MELRESGETLLMRRAASLFTSFGKTSGWIAITNRRVVIETFMFNFENGAVELDYREIRKVSKRNFLFIVPLGIKIATVTGLTYAVSVRQRDEVLAALRQELEAIRPGRGTGKAMMAREGDGGVRLAD